MNHAMKIALRRILIIGVFLAIWEGASGRLMSPFFISRPSAIATRLWSWAIDGSLFINMAITAMEAIAGFVIGGVLGALAGLALGRSPVLAETLNPIINAFNSLPKVALAPLFIMWFGVGYEMRIIFTAIIVFFLVFLNTYSGVRGVSRELVNVFRLMRAQERHLMRMVIVPSAITWIFAGLRLSVPYALIGAIVSEIMASNAGLGYLIAYYASQFNAAGVFAALVGVMLLSFLFNAGIRLLERVLMPWQEVDEQREVTI